MSFLSNSEPPPRSVHDRDTSFLLGDPGQSLTRLDSLRRDHIRTSTLTNRDLRLLTILLQMYFDKHHRMICNNKMYKFHSTFRSIIKTIYDTFHFGYYFSTPSVNTNQLNDLASYCVCLFAEYLPFHESNILPHKKKPFYR